MDIAWDAEPSGMNARLLAWGQWFDHHHEQQTFLWRHVDQYLVLIAEPDASAPAHVIEVDVSVARSLFGRLPSRIASIDDAFPTQMQPDLAGSGHRTRAGDPVND